MKKDINIKFALLKPSHKLQGLVVSIKYIYFFIFIIINSNITIQLATQINIATLSVF